MRVDSASAWIVACALPALAGVACDRTLADACADLAAASCARRAACALPPPADSDPGACERVVAERCARLPDLPGASLDAADVEACAVDYSSYSCAGLLAGASPPDCRFAGKGTNGAPCSSGAQCQSAYCKPDAEGHCGECAAVRRENDACSKGGSPCAAGLYCAEVGRCIPYGGAGDACGALAPCDALHFCNAQFVCEAQGSRGAPCASTGECSLLEGLACDPAARTCEPQDPPVLPAPSVPSCE